MVQRSGTIKSSLWAIRTLQFCFAAILIGIFAWFHNRLYHGGFYPYEVTDVPLGFSVAAIFISVLAIFAAVALGEDALVFLAIFDLALFVGYVASAIVYRHNFNVSCGKNELVRLIGATGESSCNAVRLGAALLILQCILFFISAILTYRLAGNRRTATTEPGAYEEKGRFGFRKRNQGNPNAV